MQRTLSLLSKISNAGNSFITAKLRERHYGQLAPSHGDILILLYKYKKITMQEIAAKIFRTKATVTVLVNKLEKMDFLKREKSPADSRITYISLSEKGIKFKAVFDEISKELNQMLYQNFTAGQIERLDHTLEKMLKNTSGHSPKNRERSRSDKQAYKNTKRHCSF
ncbi:MarR family winged helix-turn-helix transcriptional regulator [Candidatus Avelusimicrobium gallicola]|uniref:HTH marR-type domain-containing protein n=1 Tax=Candidatus Avelusimicrobium gallicola TaxID=2562704 RepID=A0A1Y4DDS3_9BACT|nr:MarR family transcriptional regulator [Elusimicrobium sp. An273]OUO57247.1 hypothetical protein B5F75_00250 [Elusimicrobium sp. An273]